MTGDDDDLRAPSDDRTDAPTGEPIDQLGDEVAVLLADPQLWEEPPAGLEDRIVGAVHSEANVGAPPTNRRQRSWLRPALLGAAAAVLLLFGGVVVFSALNGATGTDRFSAELVPTGLVADVEGSIEVTSFRSGLRIELDAISLPRRDGGQFYEGWLRTDDGDLVSVGTFHDGTDVTLWAGIEPERVAAFSITMERAAAPDSVDQRSSGEVVLKADIPRR